MSKSNGSSLNGHSVESMYIETEENLSLAKTWSKDPDAYAHIYERLQPPESIRPLRILLIVPKGKKEDDSSQRALFLMAVGVLVSITPKQHHVEIADELFDDTLNYGGNYDLVGITTRTMNVNRAYEIADEFRKHGKKVVLGGVHVSFNYQEAKPHADCVVIGEAEHLWETLLQDVANGELKPFYNSRHFPPVLEAPTLDYQRIFNASKRGKVDTTKSIPIYLTRGCPHTCNFCVTPNFIGRLYRIQSAETVRQQIEDAKKAFFKHYGTNKKPWFMLTDENLGVNKKKLLEVLKVVKECNINYSTFISIHFLEDEETVRHLAESGCVMALVGFESVNQERLALYNKKGEVQKYSKIVEHCRKAGLNVQGNFLVNPELDDYHDMDATETFIKENHIMMPIYSLITPYPGTELYKEYKTKGLIVDEDWDKYTATNLVVRCTKFDPLEYQIKFTEHYLAFYSWKTIFKRVWNNPHKLINLVTSVMFRKNLQEQLEKIKAGKIRPVQSIQEAEAKNKIATSTTQKEGIKEEA
ncbi:Radical SAM domain protein [Chloroherpeton thalassium ATCC 35110]|uniref:Radical SAM domain protein n=1 Tax=Chloroherpeton thalassium (strain ATCC 35110 / GB-78) TaxID=517418 RepID=B3QZ62_CHLT3|nr:radical SAM protein [Chloroherpeton thalassium]ACF13755.1 Radical SAM domain protein [Chloroherpeton thalassium ATCC 35110]